MMGAVITKIIKKIKFSAFFLGLDVGRKVERAKIIAWLRNGNDFYAQAWARDIKAERHLK